MANRIFFLHLVCIDRNIFSGLILVDLICTPELGGFRGTPKFLKERVGMLEENRRGVNEKKEGLKD